MVHIIANQIDISPTFSTNLAGFSNRTKQTSIVEDPIEINIAILKENDTFCFFVSFDLLFVTEELETEFISIFQTHFSEISRANTFLCASHTHFAPCIDNRSFLGKKDHLYFLFLVERIKLLLEKIKNQSFSECEIVFSEYLLSEINCNRRRNIESIFRKNRITLMEPDVAKKVNSELTVINFISDSKILASVLNFACHPTNNPKTDSISSEFIGVMRDKFRKENTGLPIVFTQGFAGDVRAYPPKEYSIQRRFYNFIQRSFPTKYYKFSENQYSNWLKSIQLKLEKQIPKEFSINSKVNLNYKNSTVKLIDVGLKSLHVNDLTIKSLSIGQLLFIFMSAEVLSGYDELFEGDGRKIIKVGYEGNCFGYLPTKKDILNGGYEVNEFKKYFDVSGEFSNNFEAIISESICKVL
jgi:hypothetical protein